MTTLVAGAAALWDLIAGANQVPGPGTVGVLERGPGTAGRWLPGGAAPTVALAMATAGSKVALWHPLPAGEDDDPTLRLRQAGVDLSRCPDSGPPARCIVVRVGDEAMMWSSRPSPPPSASFEDLRGVSHVVVCPVWGEWSDRLLRRAELLEIRRSLVGMLPADAFAWQWDVVIVSRQQVGGHDLDRLRARIAVVTDGRRGSRIRTGGSWVEVAACQADVIDPTGAGDVYGGVFLSALESGMTPDTAAHQASRAAAACCEEWGAQTSLVPQRPVALSAQAVRIARRSAGASSARARGALWGLACGDAFGMPGAFLPRESRLRVLGRITDLVDAPPESPYHAGYIAGRVTDDTEQALAITRALESSNGALDPELVAAELDAWMERTGGPDSPAVGPSTRIGLLAWRGGVGASQSGRRGTSNGGAMRIAPVGVLHGLRQSPLEDLIESVVAACLPTHNTVPAISAAGAVAAAIAAGVAGAGWPTVLDAGIAGARAGRQFGSWIYAPDVARRVEEAMRAAGRSGSDEELLRDISEVVGAGEPAVEAVPAAFAVAARAAGDPSEAIRLAGNLDGDSDTVAAMAGAICGAWAGEEAIPAPWRDLVEAVNRINVRGWADQLCRLAALRPAGGPP